MQIAFLCPSGHGIRRPSTRAGELERLQATAEAESEARQQTASLLESAQADCTRLQQARDELAAKLLVSSKPPLLCTGNYYI